jgi:DNA helicase HerA-like ATPase
MGAYHKKRKADAFFGRDYTGKAYPSKVWLLIDEAHVVAPNNAPSPARKALIEYVKRGRDAGLSLVMATQQPSAVDDEILSQVNISLGHRLAFGADISSALHRVPTKAISNLKVSGSDVKDFGDMLRLLAPGQCFIGDTHTSRVILMQIRPRVTSHGGYSPS